MPKKTDPRFWQSPAFSMRGQIKFPIYVSSPGPVYKVDQTTRNGQFMNTKVNIGLLLGKDDYGQSPGPAAYLPCFPNFKRAPTPKLLLPITTSTDGERNIRPSPNTYSLRDEHRSSIKSRRKGYTMKWRTKECGSEVEDAGSPGPAAYNSTDADVYKKRAPARTFGLPLKRAKAVCTDTPHAYLIVSVDGCINRCQPKRFTFGARRPQKHPPYVVPADNCPP
ncbi:hypothetical protein AGLY_005846 [Aphis glycines]|uniref:Uncharacterized protein n=1 Tax=Aphis glycines TaxID=307491 RepID=A0A6G0TS84_APHGL|nr:hypothetical protein AGLY_005846 [Aphis glycines]